MNGRCSLCSSENVQLKRSHIVPAWAYKRMCNWGRSPSVPIVVEDDRAFFSSRQMRRYLLCGPCEQRIGKSERYVAPLTFTHSHVSRLVGLARDPARSYQYPGSFRARVAVPADINCEMIGRFGVSVIWRMAVWKQIDQDASRSFLGPYHEPLRLYLLGVAPFPPQCAIHLHVVDPTLQESRNYCAIVAYPAGGRSGPFHIHQFFILGLYFQLYVGKAVYEGLHLACLVHGTPPVYFLTDPRDIGTLVACRDVFQHSQVVGNARELLKLPSQD